MKARVTPLAVTDDPTIWRRCWCSTPLSAGAKRFPMSWSPLRLVGNPALSDSAHVTLENPTTVPLLSMACLGNPQVNDGVRGRDRTGRRRGGGADHELIGQHRQTSTRSNVDTVKRRHGQTSTRSNVDTVKRQHGHCQHHHRKDRPPGRRLIGVSIVISPLCPVSCPSLKTGRPDHFRAAARTVGEAA